MVALVAGAAVEVVGESPEPGSTVAPSSVLATTFSGSESSAIVGFGTLAEPESVQYNWCARGRPSAPKS